MDMGSSSPPLVAVNSSSARTVSRPKNCASETLSNMRFPQAALQSKLCPSDPRETPATPMSSPEQKNYAEIERLEALLAALRAEPGTKDDADAIREIGLEIAIAVREVGAMLVNVGWEQSYAARKQPPA
jgi:hypothetical protein